MLTNKVVKVCYNNNHHNVLISFYALIHVTLSILSQLSLLICLLHMSDRSNLPCLDNTRDEIQTHEQWEHAAQNRIRDATDAK